jgi:hypothetical protein
MKKLALSFSRVGQGFDFSLYRSSRARFRPESNHHQPSLAALGSLRRWWVLSASGRLLIVYRLQANHISAVVTKSARRRRKKMFWHVPRNEGLHSGPLIRYSGAFSAGD